MGGADFFPQAYSLKRQPPSRKTATFAQLITDFSAQ